MASAKCPRASGPGPQPDPTFEIAELLSLRAAWYQVRERKMTSQTAYKSVPSQPCWAQGRSSSLKAILIEGSVDELPTLQAKTRWGHCY